ncbi:MAG: hypothetical protein MJ213_03225 [Bacilli bacterium]|nr:hypothetical protein [Bacilli bacterium]
MKFSKSFSFVILSMTLATLASCAGSGRKFYKLIEEVPATCTRGGMLAHYESQPDGDKETIYLDVDKKQVQLEDLIIPALGHTMTYVPEQFATCDQEGVIAHYHCATCNLDYEDEAGKILADDLHTSTKGHVMDQEWTQSETEDKHYHKCAREGCNHIEDEEDCVFDQEVVKEEYAVDDQPNTYYKSCVCGRAGTEETFDVTPKLVIDTDQEDYEAKIREAASLEDYDPSGDTQITLEDIGVSAPDYIEVPDQSAGHIFGTYDASKGIDLTYNFKFTKADNSYHSIYIGNKVDEFGLIIKFMLDRDDKYVRGFFYSTKGELVKSDGEPFYNATDNDSIFWVKGETSSAERTLEIKLEPVDTPVVAGHDMYKVSVFVDGIQFHKEAEVPTPINDLYVGYPKGYFDDDAHDKVRLSYEDSNSGNKAYIKNTVFPPRFILMDEYGDCIGSKLFSDTNTNTVNLPDLSSEGRKFVGYYDTKGAQFTSSTDVNTRTVVYPRFIYDVENPLTDKAVTLSDLGLLAPGLEESTTNNEIAGGFEEGFRRIPVGGKTTSVSISFVAQFEFAKARGGKVVDDFFQFGLPYDYKDNQTRFIFSINANSGASSLKGYVGGPATSLGEHGTEGTCFEERDFTMTEGASYLITLKYEASIYGAGLDFTFEITDLGRNIYWDKTFPGITFINSDDFSFSNPYRNYFSVIRSRADAVLTMKNAW